MIDAEPDGTAAAIAPIAEVIDDVRNGRIVALVEDRGADARCCLMLPAQLTTPRAINFMATHGRGVICLALEEQRVRALGLRLLPDSFAGDPVSQPGGARARHAVSIEARTGVSTGISAADRARTILVAIDAGAGSDDIVCPGHIFPLVARAGGVFARAGGTEAAVDLARLAGLNPSGVICEILRDDGEAATLADLVDLVQQQGIRIGTIDDLLSYRLLHDRTVRLAASRPLGPRFGGDWILQVYVNDADASEHLLLGCSAISGRAVVAHVHAIDVITDMLVDGTPLRPLEQAMQAIAGHGAGVILLPFAQQDLTTRVAGGEAGPVAFDHGSWAQCLHEAGVDALRPLDAGSAGLLGGLARYGLQITESSDPLFEHVHERG